MIETTQFEGVTQIKMSREMNGKPLYWVAAYLVEGLLVDTGCSFTAGELVSFLRNRRVAMGINTHFHEDHVGGNRAVMDAFGIDLFAHPDSIPLIAGKPRLFPYQETVWGYPEPTLVKPLAATVTAGGLAFDVIETPGHSAGHVVLLERSKGWCFSGDIFSRESVKFIRPEESAGGLVASMKKIVSLAGERLVLFTSVGRIVGDGRQALTGCIGHIMGLSEKAKALEREGRSVDGIMAALFGGEHNFAQLTNGQYTSRNLVVSLLEMEG